MQRLPQRSHDGMLPRCPSYRHHHEKCAAGARPANERPMLRALQRRRILGRRETIRFCSELCTYGCATTRYIHPATRDCSPVNLVLTPASSTKTWCMRQSLRGHHPHSPLRGRGLPVLLPPCLELYKSVARHSGNARVAHFTLSIRVFDASNWGSSPGTAESTLTYSVHYILSSLVC
ncbi:hypothetical protein K458DRAFT_173625 [Lentithecium fluviatile CBS 122367]|uniref:Uncharacterized protein n=1 Tax=Lentithecium fluviatile CBS 122367 TaxID=1168545 RepID=A0A6G1JBR6_9PLEO|nr:hypothetical protein K458DRAFT_173625 [Lentithecium fluviatile CBS 122367]